MGLDSGPGLPVALHSIFGWVLTGKVELCRPPPTTSSLFASTQGLEDVVKRFWEVEEPPSVKIENIEDVQCEKLYSELTSRDAEVRYVLVVPILLKDDHQSLGDSYSHAPSCFRNLEKRQNKNSQLKDEVVAGAPTLEAPSQLKGDLVDLLACAKFELRKWSTNCPELLADIKKEHCQYPKSFCEHSQNTLKILGVQWEPSGDFFTYSRLPSTTPPLGFTKRTILFQVARIYDPVGWLTPVVLLAKLLLQDLWRLKVGWDEPVPHDIARQWQRFDADLQYLSQIRLLSVPNNKT